MVRAFHDELFNISKTRHESMSGEVPPSPGEGGGSEGTAQSQAFEDVEQDVVRETAQPVFFFMLAFIAS